MADLIKFLKGAKSKLTRTLNLAEPCYITDEERLYIGGLNGNVSLPNKQDLDEVKSQLADIPQQTYITEKAKTVDVNNALNLKATKTELNQEKTNRQAEIAIERARIDSFTVLPVGSTAGDAELIDARVGANGIIYANAGNAIRSQLENLAIVSAINYLLHTDIITSYLYDFTTHKLVANTDCNAYKPIKITAGKTYYFRNIWAYFSHIKYVDNSYVCFDSIHTATAYYGSFTAVQDGYVYITVNKGNSNYLFTDNAKIYNSLEYDTIYSPNLLTVPILDTLKVDVEAIATSNINYLGNSTVYDGFNWDLNSHELVTNVECKAHIFRVKKGTTYYYKGIWGYFSVMKYDNGTNVNISADTSDNINGSFTAVDDGYACITVHNTILNNLFTDSEELYNSGANKTYYKPNLLQFDFIQKYKNILDDKQIITNTLWDVNSTDKVTSADAKTIELIPVYAGVTYYYRNLWGYFSILYNQDGTKTRITNNVMTQTFGSFTPAQNGNLGITVHNEASEYLLTTDKKIYSDNIMKTGNILQEVVNNGVQHIYHVEQDGTGDFVKLIDAIHEAEKYMNSIVYLGKGTYDILNELGTDYLNGVSEFKKGIVLKNGIHIICSSDSQILCNYEGISVNVHKYLSVFNAGIYGFTLENATIRAKNLRYAIHDERENYTDGYVNKYKNCYMYFDNSANNDTLGEQCIGGGLGRNGYVEIDGCIFEGVGATALVSYHNSHDGEGRNNIFVKNSYFSNNGTVRFNWYGASTEITTAFVMGCSLGRSIISQAETSDGTSPNVNISVKEWNNTIRV